MAEGKSLLEGVASMPLPRGISQAKKDEILKLVASIAQHKRLFYDNLPVDSQAADLEIEFDH